MTTYMEHQEARMAYVSPVLNLAPDEQAFHADVIEATLAEPAVQGALAEFKRHDDRETYQHCLRVAELAVGAAVRLGMDERTIAIAARGAVTHDIGKSVAPIHAAVKHPATFARRPDLLPIIQQHPKEGVALGKRHGLSGNVLKMIGLHHSLQTNRMPYGTDDTYEGVPEADGFVPDIRRLVGVLASADVWDAFTLDAHASRPYLRGMPAGPAVARRSIETLQTTDDIRAALLQVVRYPAA